MSLATEVRDSIERPPAQPRPWTGARIAGVAFLALWAVLGLFLFGYLVSRWNPDLFSRYFPYYMKGLWVTVQIVVISIILGALLSIPVAWARMSSTASSRHWHTPMSTSSAAHRCSHRPSSSITAWLVPATA